ncbi:MAG: DUF4143 domain-containing protein [Spirochaetes bacterium]|nr:DUF4143 domain-containing protein [Spirochaetota bacterium]
MLARIRSSRTLLDLLKLLAFQIGNEVSVNELATALGIDTKTVKRYLDLLEKSFVIVRLDGFSRNLREEVTIKAKYYFLDNGIRNSIISNFNRLDHRNDLGQLWEDFILIERLKFRTYCSMLAGMYFWRTYQQQGIDLIEEREGRLFAYECKWSKTKKVRTPAAWVKAYPEAVFQVITSENYQDFILP